VLLAQGHQVTGVDSFVTGSRDNIAHLAGNPGFSFVEADLVHPLPETVARAPWNRIYHLASPASPVGYVKHQIVTLKVNALATMNLLELAERTKARIFMASTSECYGDPLEHPQKETYWGHVNSIGMRSM
jgi:nucleoside-diphosphate-sugar epimerase